MQNRLSFSRCSLQISAFMLITVALVVVKVVLPAVGGEFIRGGTPEVAIYAFWGNVFFSILTACVIWFIARRSKVNNFLLFVVFSILTLIILVLAWTLGDAAAAYSSHGPEMHVASIILFCCSAVNFIALILMIVGGALIIRSHGKIS